MDYVFCLLLAVKLRFRGLLCDILLLNILNGDVGKMWLTIFLTLQTLTKEQYLGNRLREKEILRSEYALLLTFILS